MNDIWIDGICKCGYLVIEMPIDAIDIDHKPMESRFADYKNMCLNPKCKEHKWHYVEDQEELDYYVHDLEAFDKMQEKLKQTWQENFIEMLLGE